MYCRKCGKNLPDDSRFCSFCGYGTMANEPEQSLNSMVQNYETTNNQLEVKVREVGPASRLRRFLNHILDCVFFIVFCFFVRIILAILGLDDYISKMDDFLSSVLLWIIYFLIFESIFARTPAKFVTKTIVVKLDGSKPGFLSVLGRTLSRFIPFEAFTFLSSENPVGLHDSLSGTVVVMTEELYVPNNKRFYS